MRGKISIVVMAMLLTFTCSIAMAEEFQNTTDLTGIWQSASEDDSWMEAVIEEDSISVYWVFDNDSTRSIYWAGTFDPPEESVEEYTWISERNTEMTDSELLASSDDTKDFTYRNGALYFEASALGMTETEELFPSQENIDIYDMSIEELQAAYTQLQSEYQELQNKYDTLASSDDNSEDESTNEIAETPETADPSTDFVSQLETTEYTYVNSSGKITYFIVVKNNSPYTLSISAEITASDKDGKLLGANTSTKRAVESGYEVLLSSSFDEADSFSYNLSAKEETFYGPALSDLEYEVSQNENNVVISCTNIGSEAIKYVEAEVLFFKDGEIIYKNSTYFTDDDQEIKPGATIIKEVKSRSDEFDKAKIYFYAKKDS